MNRIWLSMMLGIALAFAGCGDDGRPPIADGGPGDGGGGDGGGGDAGDGATGDAGDTGVPPADTGVPPGDTSVPTDSSPGDGGDLCASVDCSSLDGECTMGVCNTATGACEAQPIPDGTACEDGDMCTSADICTAGTCGGAAVDCSGASDMCNTGVCDATTGACMATPVADGTGCDDGAACTAGDACSAGVCGGAAVDCSAMSDMCNVGFCEAATGACMRMPMADGSSCSDGSLCTTGDVCTAGTCGGTAVDCSGSSDMCNVGTCNAATGACVATPVTNGTACDDSNACSTSDVCTGGTCGGTAVVPAGDVCGSRIALSGADGTRTVTGNNECATNAGESTCGLTGGRDLIYRMNLPGPRQVRYETVVPAAGSQYDTVLHARRTCATPATELVCDDDDGPGLLSIIDESFDAGAHFLYVDGYTAAAAGNYELDVTVRTPDTCATAPTFTLPARGSTLRFTGSTTTATNAAGATCGGGAASPDHAFTFTVTTPTALRIETVAPASGQYDTVLHVRSACGTAGSEVACDDDAGAGLLSQIIRVFSPGTYTLFVDGYLSGASGNYAVEIEHLRGHAVLIGHDYFASNADQDRIVGNAAFLANTAGTVEILEYTQYSDNAVGGEAENTRTAIDARATALGRTVNYTTLATSGGLAAALPGKHVLLIPEQENASGAQMTAVATAWNAQLNAFIGAGGVVIVCDYSGESWRIMNGAGLFSIASSTSLGIDTPMTVVTATDPVATGVLSPYLGANGSISYPGATGGVVVSRAASGASVVRHIAR